MTVANVVADEYVVVVEVVDGVLSALTERKDLASSGVLDADRALGRGALRIGARQLVRFAVASIQC